MDVIGACATVTDIGHGPPYQSLRGAKAPDEELLKLMTKFDKSPTGRSYRQEEKRIRQQNNS